MTGVSIKGVLFDDRGGDRRVVLLRNERSEWELPGGQPDATDASPEATVGREIAEELQVDVTVGALIDSWYYEPLPGRQVTIITYLCTAPAGASYTISSEHNDLACLPLDGLSELALPEGYRRSIMLATEMTDS